MAVILIVTAILVGCQTSGSYRTKMGLKARRIIMEKQSHVPGMALGFFRLASIDSQTDQVATPTGRIPIFPVRA